MSRVESFGGTDPTLAALADTIDMVIKGGAQARRIDVTTDIGSGPFWAVSLQMTSSSPSSGQAWSGFHMIAFNEPNNPTTFIILGGSAFAQGTTSPNTATGTCVVVNMAAGFDITGTVAGQGASGQRTASGTVSGIPGIKVSM